MSTFTSPKLRDNERSSCFISMYSNDLYRFEISKDRVIGIKLQKQGLVPVHHFQELPLAASVRSDFVNADIEIHIVDVICTRHLWQLTGSIRRSCLSNCRHCKLHFLRDISETITSQLLVPGFFALYGAQRHCSTLEGNGLRWKLNSFLLGSTRMWAIFVTSTIH